MAFSSPYIKACSSAKDPILVAASVAASDPVAKKRDVMLTTKPIADRKDAIKDIVRKRLLMTSPVCDGLSWNTIPEMILIKIYKHLSVIDRAQASGVCRHWNEVCKMPELWRKFEFEIRQESTSYFKSTPPKLIKQVLQQHSKHLKSVTIKVDSHQSSAEAACDILSQLVNCSLKTLELMLTAKTSVAMVNPDRFLMPLTVVLVNSPSLRSLALDQTPIDDPWLETLAVSSKDSLMLLKIDSCPLVSSQGMLHVADSCRQLHELTINYMHLSDDLLLSLSNEKHVRLKHLCVNVICEDNETYVENHVIEKESWDALTKHSPSIILAMCFFVLHDKDYSPFFQFEMPVTHIYFGRSVSRDVLIRIGSNCPRLQELVVCANGSQPLDNPLVTIARKCKNLHSLGLGECEISCSCVVDVARLCGKRLTELFIREEVVREDDKYDIDKMCNEVSELLDRPWSVECMPFWME